MDQRGLRGWVHVHVGYCRLVKLHVRGGSIFCFSFLFFALLHTCILLVYFVLPFLTLIIYCSFAYQKKKKKRKKKEREIKNGRLLPCAYFGLFEDVEQMDQALNSSLLCICLEWVRVRLTKETMPMVDFVDWLASL